MKKTKSTVFAALILLSATACSTKYPEHQVIKREEILVTENISDSTHILEKYDIYKVQISAKINPNYPQNVKTYGNPLYSAFTEVRVKCQTKEQLISLTPDLLNKPVYYEHETDDGKIKLTIFDNFEALSGESVNVVKNENGEKIVEIKQIIIPGYKTSNECRIPKQLEIEESKILEKPDKNGVIMIEYNKIVPKN